MDAAIEDFRTGIDQSTDKIYTEKRDNFRKICSITDNFLSE